jgi:hypothetical protein
MTEIERASEWFANRAKTTPMQGARRMFELAAEALREKANGVTAQELDGCEYCKEDSEGFRRMFGAFSITNPFHGNEWFIDTGHCKPRQICFCPMCGRKLPKPPRGE